MIKANNTVLKNLSAEQQMALLELLREAQDPSCIPLLEELYKSKSKKVRDEVVYVADKIYDDPRADEFILHIALHDKNIRNRGLAVFSLGLRDKKYVKPLSKLALDKTQQAFIRDNAADALGDQFEFSKNPLRASGIKVLEKCLEDSNADVRWTACFSLGKLKSRSSVAALRKLAKTDKGKSQYGSVAKQAECAANFIVGKSDILDERDLTGSNE